MKSKTFQKLSGTIEADETFIGGLAKNMHRKRREEANLGRGGEGKAAVLGVLARGGKIVATTLDKVDGDSIHEVIHKTVEKGSRVYTDAFRVYRSLHPDYIHDFVDHSVQYVKGQVHTKGLENFWALFKGCIKGTYIAIDLPHLNRYLDEQIFRYDERTQSDAGRFKTIMPGVVGRRLRYKTLIGDNTIDNVKKDGASGSGLAN